MNNDTIQRITHLLANLEQVPYSEFCSIKKYIATTQYDASFGQLFESIDNFYKTRHNKFPDFAWLSRQYPSYFVNCPQVPLHSDDIYVLSSILREESYKNKVLSATYKDNLDESLNLLTEYKQNSLQIVQAPTKATQVFANFSEDRDLYGKGIKTGILPIDQDIDFLPYKAFCALISPVKSFKTMTACNIVYDAVMNQGKNVVYATLEDQYRSIWANLLAKHSYIMGLPITTNEIKKYKLTKERDNLFVKMQENFDASATGHFVCLSAETTPTFEPGTVESYLRYYEKLWGSIDMVVFDHLSIADDPIPGQNLSGHALAKAYVRALTKLCINFSKQGFVFLGLGQVTREYTELLIKGEKMRATGAANTSEIERSCEIYLTTFASDEMKKSGNMSISIVINRNGPSDVTHTIPIKPEYACIGEQFIEEYDDETLDALVNGNLEIPIKKFMNFGMSFTQFCNGLKNIQ